MKLISCILAIFIIGIAVYTLLRIEYNPVPVTLGEVIYGNGTSEPPTSYKDAAGQVYNMQYNSFDQLTSIEDPNHQTVTYDYTTTGLLHRKNSPDPYRYIEFTYDEYDRVASATMFPDAYTLRYEYDNGDRLTKVTYPDNTYEEQKWDKLGVVASRDRLGRWTQMRYSLLGQIESVTNPAGETIQYAWCTCGSLSRVVDAEGKITAYTRDVAGRLVKEELPDHSVTTYSYQPLGGKLQSKTDPKGQVHHIAYHPDGSIFKTWTTNVAAGTAGVSEVEYAWHPEFKRLTEWHDNLGTTTLSYVPYNNSDSIYGDGKLLSTTTPWSGDVITNAYDNLGRRISQSIGGNQYFNLVQYDSDGRVTSSTNNLGTSLYSYAPHTGRVVGVSNSYQNTYFGYENGLKDFALKSIDAPLPFGDGGKYFDYEQDVVGRITKWSKGIYGEEGNENELSASYDNADRLLSLVSASGWDGLKGRWDWRISKAENRLNSQTEKFVEGESTFLQRQSYTTNDGDQLVTVASGGPLHIAGQLNEQGKINTGLQSSPVPTAPDGKFSSWINTSQLASATFSVEDFKGNGRNVTVNATSAVPAPAYAFEYDANGNTTRMITTETDGVTTSEITYEWDARDQLVAINIGQHRSEFSYDGVGRRIRIKEFQNNFVQSDKCYLWNNLKIIASGEHATPGVNSAQKKYFANGFINYGTPWYYTKDHLGSIVIASNGYDDDTNINYDPYGVPGLTGEFADEIDFLYTGHFYHRNSGLYLAPHRIYNPRVGRWLSREPKRHDGPNLYNYVKNSTLMFYDLDGLKRRKIILFDPNAEPNMIEPIGPGGVYINNIDDLNWYLNNRVENGDDVGLYGHGNTGFIAFGPATAWIRITPSNLKVTKSLNKSNFTFYSCHTFGGKNADDFAGAWQRALGGAGIQGSGDAYIYSDDEIYPENGNVYIRGGLIE